MTINVSTMIMKSYRSFSVRSKDFPFELSTDTKICKRRPPRVHTIRFSQGQRSRRFCGSWEHRSIRDGGVRETGLRLSIKRHYGVPDAEPLHAPNADIFEEAHGRRGISRSRSRTWTETTGTTSVGTRTGSTSDDDDGRLHSRGAQAVCAEDEKPGEFHPDQRGC